MKAFQIIVFALCLILFVVSCMEGDDDDDDDGQCVVDYNRYFECADGCREKGYACQESGIKNSSECNGDTAICVDQCEIDYLCE